MTNYFFSMNFDYFDYFVSPEGDYKQLVLIYCCLIKELNKRGINTRKVMKAIDEVIMKFAKEAGDAEER